MTNTILKGRGDKLKNIWMKVGERGEEEGSYDVVDIHIRWIPITEWPLGEIDRRHLSARMLVGHIEIGYRSVLNLVDVVEHFADLAHEDLEICGTHEFLKCSAKVAAACEKHV